MNLNPLRDFSISPVLAALPKADLHIHQEDTARFERVAAERMGRLPYDPRPWIKQMMVETEPGIGRIAGVYAPDDGHDFGGLRTDDPEIIIAKMAHAMFEGAKDGSVYMELRFGVGSTAFNHPDFMALFREAEKQVQARFPRFFAEALCFIVISEDEGQVRRQFDQCLQAAKNGLAGVDFRIDSYDSEANPLTWLHAYRLAEQAVEHGLGITIHAGEFSPANILAAARTPGVRRLGHAVYTVAEPRIIEAVASSGVTVECSLTCNVVLGAVASYEKHPIRQMMENGIAVTLNTDLPVHLRTTIGREYVIAAVMGFSTLELLHMTRSSIDASFTSESRRVQLIEEVQSWPT